MPVLPQQPHVLVAPDTGKFATPIGSAGGDQRRYVQQTPRIDRDDRSRRDNGAAIMSDLALFELEAPAWEPVYLPKYAWVGSAMDATAEQWKAHHKQYRCRDCGKLLSKLKHTRGCGGGGRDGLHELVRRLCCARLSLGISTPVTTETGWSSCRLDVVRSTYGKACVWLKRNERQGQLKPASVARRAAATLGSRAIAPPPRPRVSNHRQLHPAQPSSRREGSHNHDLNGDHPWPTAPNH